MDRSQGLIDVEKEVAKLLGKKADLEKQIKNLSEKISKGDYKEKVPVKVQEQDAEKVGRGGKRRWSWGGQTLIRSFLLNGSYGRVKRSWRR